MEQTGHLNNDFRTCLSHLMTHGTETSPRGSKSREILNYNITLQNPRNRVITFAERNTNTKYLLGEFIWYLTGSNDPAGILPYSKFWDNIRNTNNLPGYPSGTVNSNYGNRLFGISDVDAFHGVNQWKETIDLLTKDKDSRQAIMNIHVPSDRHNGNKDVACTLTLQFLIRENKLHMITNMRSNDIILGFTNDVFQFTMLQECLMLELRAAYPQLELGHYYHNAGSMHVYERHYEMAQKIVSQPNAFDLNMIPMDRFDDEIRQHLLCVEQELREANFAEDFDFDFFEFNELTPYWQTLIKALFMKDEDAMHALFAVPDDNVPMQMID
jgi:thymidylate synthase